MNLFDLVFPKKCVGCRKVGKYFCEGCVQKILQNDLICPSCKRVSLGGITHPLCKKRYGLDGLWSLGAYKTPLRDAIQKLKYKWIKGLAQDLTDITIDYWAKSDPLILDLIAKDQGKNWQIVPVPLHKFRANWRGFNQSAELAKILSQKIGLEYKEALIRTKNTIPQVKLQAYKRRQNIKNAFSLNSKYPIQDLCILLVDDVWTTGSTLKECSYVLKSNGAKKVWALTLAR